MYNTKNYSPQKIDGQMCIWLQSHGWQPARMAKDLKIGDFLMWNSSGISKILSVKKETKCFITFETQAPDCWGNWAEGEKWLRRVKKTRLVAIATRKEVKLYTRNHELVL